MPRRAAQLSKNLERFRLITFDVTDTLLRFQRAPAIQYAKTAAEYGVANVHQERLKECFKKEFKFMASAYPNFGSKTAGMTWQDWWMKLVERIFLCEKPDIPKEKLQVIAKTLVDIYRTNACWLYTRGSEEILQRLCQLDKKLGVISNFDPSLRLVLQAMHIEHYFDLILTSHEAGMMKPDTGIFKEAQKRCQVKPSEALHIGNIYEIDYLGAREAGWSSLLLCNNIKENCDIVKQHCYVNLEDLLNALETRDIKW